MLQFRKKNLVARLEVRESPGVGDEIDSFGGATREDDFLRGAGVDEPGGALAPVARLLSSWMPRWTFALSCS
jgi:hypothetical protein